MSGGCRLRARWLNRARRPLLYWLFRAVSRAPSSTFIFENANDSHRLGFKALRIIHGRGIGAQREMVRRVLASKDYVADFADAPAEAGGWGATIVTLR